MVKTIYGTTISSRDALKQLKSVKPSDGWSIQIHDNETGMRLLRRNAPLTDGFFLDIHYSPKTNTVVGVLTRDGDACQILVDGRSGRPVLQKSVGRVSCAKSYPGYQKLSLDSQRGPSSNQEGRGAFAGRTTSSSTTNRTSASSNTRINRASSQPSDTNAAPANPFENMSEEDKQLYMKYAALAIGAWVVYQILSNALGDTFLIFLILPGAYFYGLQTCPENSSFDAKKEVKRVLRGHHLPDDHPAKPRRGSFLEEWTAKISASVTTEVGAMTGGYSTEIAPLLGGCVKHAVVTLPTLGLTCEWIGAHGTWYHYRTYTAES